jgi:DnaJ-class molecular chaperone
MKMVKCPQCDGKGEYIAIQKWQGIEFDVPVKCNCNNGKISWSEYCLLYRKRK